MLVVAVGLILDRNHAPLGRLASWLPLVGMGGFLALLLLLGAVQGLYRVSRGRATSSNLERRKPREDGAVADEAPATGLESSASRARVWPYLVLAALWVATVFIDATWEVWLHTSLGAICLAVALHRWQQRQRTSTHRT